MDDSQWEAVRQFVSEPDMGPEKNVSENTPALMLTPSMSIQGSPWPLEEYSEAHTTVSVSTMFFPGATTSPLPPDLIVFSSDAVFFYVHCHRLLAASDNWFNSELPPTLKNDPEDALPIVYFSESAGVLNIMLLTVYNIPCSQYAPSGEILTAALDALVKYGISVQTHLAPSTPLYSAVLAQAPLAPIQMYALAARHDLYELAVPISAHLLSFLLSALTDEQAAQMGPIYLKRLFFLHLGRSDALKRLLLSPPHSHASTPTCDVVEQKNLTRAWALVSAYLVWEAQPDLSISSMENALRPLGERLSCAACQSSLSERISQLSSQWGAVKRTI